MNKDNELAFLCPILQIFIKIDIPGVLKWGFKG
jgi:hypothetical protein